MRLSGRVIATGTAPRRVDWLQGSCLLLPRPLFDEIGGFDERYFMYSEEVDLQRRLRSIGIRAWLLPGIVVTHTGGASTSSLDVGERMMQSRLLYADKFGEGRRMRAALKVVAVLNLGRRLLLRATGRASAPRQAWRREWRRADVPVAGLPDDRRS